MGREITRVSSFVSPVEESLQELFNDLESNRTRLRQELDEILREYKSNTAELQANFVRQLADLRDEQRAGLRPPGARELSQALSRFGERHFSARTNTLVLAPTLDDLQFEYAAALASGSSGRAWWVLLRGTWSFVAAIAAHLVGAMSAEIRSRFG